MTFAISQNITAQILKEAAKEPTGANDAAFENIFDFYTEDDDTCETADTSAEMKALLEETGRRIMQEMRTLLFGKNSINIDAAADKYKEALKSAVGGAEFKDLSKTECDGFIKNQSKIYKQNLANTYDGKTDKSGYAAKKWVA